jgi:hypothetical protein
MENDINRLLPDFRRSIESEGKTQEQIDNEVMAHEFLAMHQQLGRKILQVVHFFNDIKGGNPTEMTKKVFHATAIEFQERNMGGIDLNKQSDDNE